MSERIEEDPQESRSQDDQPEDAEGDDETVEVQRAELERLKEERDEFENKYMRKLADLQNLRKRKDKERKDSLKYAHKDMAADVLEIVDNFERALENMTIENESVREGIAMIRDQLYTLLEKYDVRPIQAENQPFDPHFHEAMMQEEREELDEKKVLEVFKKGYKIHDRVLRPASVKVGVPEPEGTPAGEATSAEESEEAPTE